MIAVRKFDEDETAVTHLSRDPRENHIELGQVFVEGLAAPKSRTDRRPFESHGSIRQRRRRSRFVIDRQVGEQNQSFSVVLLAVGRFHQVAAEKIVQGWKPAGLWV